MDKEIKEYVESLIKEKTSKDIKKSELDFGDIFKSNFTLGSTLTKSIDGNILSNTREHNPTNDLKKAYNKEDIEK